ncbi:MAG: YceI family protein [Parafilimonas sp.]
MELIEWALDAHHSELMFKVKHLMITTVTGYFKKFTVEAETEGEDFTKFLNIAFEADVNSVSTNNEQRDIHLKSPDFFNVAKYPTIRFTATEFKNNELLGNLTLKATTKSISMHVDFGGIATDAYGQAKAGFSVYGSISRKDFGLTWNHVTETGNVVVSDEVKFQAEIQLLRSVVTNKKSKEELLVTEQSI